MTSNIGIVSKIRICILGILGIWLCPLLSAQPVQKVSHLNGTQRINDIDVTVTSKGLTAILRPNNYCNREAGPYYMGYNTTTYECATGSYTFSFNPPVAFVTLNFEGLSSSIHYYEEVIIDVNGHHYPITEAGFKTPCEPKCFITPNGNLTGCDECSSSGWNGTHIEGPIYTLTITDSVILGEPAGVVFGLYLSYVSLEQDLGSKVCTYKKESAAGSTLIIEPLDSVDVRLVSVSNGKGIKEPYHNYSQDPFITVDLAGYVPGEEYTFEMLVNDQLIHKKLIIW